MNYLNLEEKIYFFNVCNLGIFVFVIILIIRVIYIDR